MALKGLLRTFHIEVPWLHDVSEILIKEKAIFPKSIAKAVTKLAEISRDLRRDRELAFYGSEDLTPSDFYKKADAEKARKKARWLVATIAVSIKK